MKPGKIITFYSFKGGVGRSMALANAAYIAACNGLSVLTMDWDLEAPGLAYYFRGFTDANDIHKLSSNPGILNLLWDWQIAIQKVKRASEAERLIADAQRGEILKNSIQHIGADIIPSGKLDFIGAGSSQAVDGELISYADALTKFSWNEFYGKHRGGLLIQSIREWAKNNYDLVLIDSRTGLADVAGLCTMQLPDEVALCFILNRQNISGIATVAGAIRSQRNEQVVVRAVPMRMQRSESAELSDAQARAKAELTTVGGFSVEAVNEDFKRLNIATDPALPFYEVLAPLAPAFDPDTSPDPLTTNYVDFTRALLNIEISVPIISKDALSAVRLRLQPKLATLDYVKNLRQAEPGRVATEMHRLLSGIQEAVVAKVEIDATYVEAIVDLIFFIEDTLAQGEFEAIQSLCLDLLRELYSQEPAIWVNPLVNFIERLLLSPSISRRNEIVFSLLEEIDAILEPVNTTASKIKRLRARRQAAWLNFHRGDQKAAREALIQIDALTSELHCGEAKLGAEQSEQIACSEIDRYLLAADIEKYNRQYGSAFKYLTLAVLVSAPEYTSAEFRQLKARAHVNLAIEFDRQDDLDNAATHAIEVPQANLNEALVHFSDLVGFVAKATDRAHASISLAKALFVTDASAMEQLLGSYYGRTASTAAAFCESVAVLIEGIDRVDDATLDALRRLTSAVEASLKAMLRRRHVIGSGSLLTFEPALRRLQGSLVRSGINWEMPATLQDDVTQVWPELQKPATTTG